MPMPVLTANPPEPNDPDLVADLDLVDRRDDDPPPPVTWRWTLDHRSDPSPTQRQPSAGGLVLEPVRVPGVVPRAAVRLDAAPRIRPVAGDDIVPATTEAGQATAEYALVLLGAAAIALLVVSWATKTNVVGKLLDVIFSQLIGKAGGSAGH